jgi:hypothetical protein
MLWLLAEIPALTAALKPKGINHLPKENEKLPHRKARFFRASHQMSHEIPKRQSETLQVHLHNGT